jgi:hypothetical protein
MSEVLPPKERARYRLTRYSILWIVAAALLIPYEIVMVVTGHDGGPLTHVVKWAYGDEWSLRWCLLGWGNTGFILWMAPHFLFEGWGFSRLVALVAAGAVLGGIAYLITR